MDTVSHRSLHTFGRRFKDCNHTSSANNQGERGPQNVPTRGRYGERWPVTGDRWYEGQNSNAGEQYNNAEGETDTRANPRIGARKYRHAGNVNADPDRD